MEFDRTLIEWIVDSEGNFADTKISNQEISLDDEILESIFYKLKSSFFKIDFETHYSEKLWKEKYKEGFNRVNVMNEEIESFLKRVKIESISEMLENINNDEKNDKGLFVKEAKMTEILFSNIPKDTIRVMREGASLEECLRDVGIYKLMALTRLYEGDEWHERAYKHYSGLTEKDFEEREIQLFSISEFNRGNKTEIYKDKSPIWEEKIMGSIFVFGFDSFDDGKILRAITKFFHYKAELLIHSEVIKKLVGYTNFGERFLSYFLQSERGEALFFEPHCITEAICWQESIIKLWNLLEQWQIENEYFKEGEIGITFDNKIIVSNNILDAISNSFKKRNYPGKHRMFSMLYKLAYLEHILDSGIIRNLLISNADKDSILRC